MFQLAREKKVWWPTEINVPQDGGSVKTYTVSILYSLMKETAEALYGMTDGDVVEVLKSHIHDWKAEDFGDDDKKPIPYSAEILSEYLEFKFFRQGCGLALTELSNGTAVKKT